MFGLLRSDVDFRAGWIRIEPNEHRSLETRHSKRDVPLWPQLREIQRSYPKSREDNEPLLFPAPGGGTLTKIRSALDELQDRAEIAKRLIPLVFRHTYTATRIQTVDDGAPVSPFTVARELSHRGIERIEDTYARLQWKRKRLEAVRHR